MRIGLFALPFGLLELVLIAVLIILVLKAITGNKRAGRSIVTVLIVIAAVMVISIGALFAALFATRSVVVNHTAQQQAVIAAEQAHAETERAREQILAMEEEVRAKAEEIRERTTVQVDRIATVPMPADNPGVPTSVDSPAQPSNTSVQSGVFETESSIGSWSVSGTPSWQSGVIETETSIGTWSVSGAPSSNAAQKPRGITVDANTPYATGPNGHSRPMAHTSRSGVGISLFLLIILAFLGMGFFVLVAVVIAVISRHRGRRHVLGRALAGAGVAAVVIVACLGVYAFMSQSVQYNQSSVSYSASESQPQALAGSAYGQDQSQASYPIQSETVSGQGSGVTVAGQPWTSEVEEFQDFEADVYPSIEAAAEALGRRVGRQLVDSFESAGQATEMVYVWRDSDREGGHSKDQEGNEVVTPDLLEAVAQGLRQKLDEPVYVSVEDPASPDAVAVIVAIQGIDYEGHNRWRKQAQSPFGGLALRVETPDGPFSVSTRFAETPWIVDRSTFADKYPGNWLVAYSDGTHSTHEDARSDALNTASEVLLPLARARINHMSGSDQHQFNQLMAKNPNWLRDRVRDELVSRNLAPDQFTQQFDRPYGPVWREAVLINATPNRVEEIARSLVQGVNVRVAHQRTTWFSYIALAVLVFGTYLFLNMATKGYYAWSLRAALVVGLFVVAIIILNYA